MVEELNNKMFREANMKLKTTLLNCQNIVYWSMKHNEARALEQTEFAAKNCGKALLENLQH